MRTTGFSERYRNVAFLLIALLTLGLATATVLPFLPAILWAAVLSILTYPVFRRLNVRLEKVKALQGGHSRTAASLLTTLFTLFLVCIPFALVVGGSFLQAGSATQGLTQGGIEGAVQRAETSLLPLMEKLGVKDFSISKYVQEHSQEIVQNLRAPATKFAGQVLVTVLTLVIALLTQFFMLRDGDRLREPAQELLPISPEHSQDLLERVAETVRAVFIGTVLVAIIQGALIGVAYALAGVPNALLLGVVSAILCVVPLLGAPVIYIPVGLALLISGNLQGALIVLGMGFIVVSQIDNVLKPFFIGGRVNLHPMAIFFSILGGVLLVGPIGVMAGPMLLTVLLALHDVVRERLKEGKELEIA
jgi:predicted PurR-regulated permease PerM